MTFHDAFMACVYAGAVAAVATIADIRHEHDVNKPSLTQIFQCSQPTGARPFHTRVATLMSAQDRKTGAKHLELQLTQLADSARPSGVLVWDDGTVDYPAGASVDEAIRQAKASCANDVVPPNFVVRRDF